MIKIGEEFCDSFEKFNFGTRADGKKKEASCYIPVRHLLGERKEKSILSSKTSSTFQFLMKIKT